MQTFVKIMVIILFDTKAVCNFALHDIIENDFDINEVSDYVWT